MKFIYILGFPPFDWIGEKIINGIASLFFSILLLLNTAIYSFISYIYNIFLLLAGGANVFDESQINGLVNRVYVIIGVVVLFLVAYSLLKSMINPDESLKGKKSPVNIIKDVIISIVLISFVPTIFEFAFEFQNSLLVENTIGKLIAGSKTGDTDNQQTIRDGGYNMAEGVWQAFIYVNPDGDEEGNPYCSNKAEEENEVTEDGVPCKKVWVNGNITFADLWESARANTTFMNMILLVPRILDGQVNYIFLLDTIAGLFVLFVLLRYCLDMALRLVKLAVYELMAPIPILARIIPNEQVSKVFNNWVKATLSTFVEVFIRIAILYFAVIIISTVGSSLTNVFSGSYLHFANSKHLFLTGLIARALIIIGIIMFVQQAPAILKEITGVDSGKYGKSLMKGVGMMVATLGGAATAGIRTVATADKATSGLRKGLNALAAGAGGAARGLYHGNKAEKFGDMPKAAGKAASSTLAKRAKVQAAGGNMKYFKQWRDDKAKDIKGWVSGSFEAQQKMLDTINEMTKLADTVKNRSEDFVKSKKYLFKYAPEDENGNPIEIPITEDIEVEKEVETTDAWGRVGTRKVKEKQTVTLYNITGDTTLSQIEDNIASLRNQGHGDAADKLNNLLQVRMKDIAKQMLGTIDNENNTRKFNDKFSTAASKGIENEAFKESIEIKESFATLQENIHNHPEIAKLEHLNQGQSSGKINGDLSELTIEEAGDFSKYLGADAFKIQREIASEQKRRKENEKK